MRKPILMLLILFSLVPGLRAQDNSSPDYSVVVSISAQKTYVYSAGRLVRSMTCSTGMGQTAVPAWLAAHFSSYRQRYPLSCEIALTRLSLAIFGIEASEDEILSTIPREGRDPERAFVCDDINGGRRLKGKILWDNYGTHPPVVAAEIERRLEAAGLSGRYEAKEIHADDEILRALIRNDPRFLGAILWLVGHPERWGEKPPVNERGMVLGEHVRFLEPALAADASFRIWDPENGKLIVSTGSGVGREFFDYRIVGLFSR